MKSNFVLAVIFVLGLVVWLLLGKREAVQIISPAASTNDVAIDETRRMVPPLPAGGGERSTSKTVSGLTESTNELILIRTNLHSLMPTPEAAPLVPATVLDNARVVIHNYAAQFGENPVGDNAEITAALTGKNPKQVNFLREDSGLRVNSKGEMIDAYGTPLFFHQQSATLMEIRSAGEDRKLWTLDDQVAR